MYNIHIIINLLVLLILIIFVSLFALDMKEPYPKNVIKYFSEPYVRFLSYMIVYALTFYNNTIAIVFLIGILLLHIDYINLVITD